MTEFNDFISLLDVHEMLNKENEETLAESYEELRSIHRAMTFNADRTPETNLYGEISNAVQGIRFKGYCEGFNDAIKQMKVIMLKTKTRKGQLEHETIQE